MWFLGLLRSCKRNSMRCSTLKNLVTSDMREVVKHFHSSMDYSTLAAVNDDQGKGSKRLTLAKDLAFLVEESPSLEETRRPRSRMELKRSLELRIKKKVKEQYVNGKFHNLMRNVIGIPETLQDAYNCIRLNSNVDIESDSGGVSFESMAEELTHGRFDISSNTFSISTRGAKKETLILPKLKLRIVQEAMRIVLETVYRPHFSKISHGCRSGRGHNTALKFIKKEISSPDWWFTLNISKKLDANVLNKLISMMEGKVEDPFFYDMIQGMFNAQVLNLEFGGFPKGHGLPQEGVLSPILLNIYFDVFDSEFLKLSMKYEALSLGDFNGFQIQSKLRSWFRRQLKGNSVATTSEGASGPRVYCCRFMDELFFAVSGLEDFALSFKSEIVDVLENSMHLNVDTQTEILPSTGPHGVQYLGAVIRRRFKETPAIRAVHKLKEKIKLLASQKKEAWDIGTIRIGKKWLGHGLRKVKESEIKHLADPSSLLSKISCFRKAGMETDHWYKHLLKIWMQDINARAAGSEEYILSKYVAEPALPQDLKNSFYEFQKLAEEYINSETATTLAIFPDSSSTTEIITEIIAPVDTIKKRLLRYGLVSLKGRSRTNPLLIFQDDADIIDWFSGIVQRWLRWYADFDNFAEVNLLIIDQVRKSCIRTLAAKYRIHEDEIERRFDLELSNIPSTLGTEHELIQKKSDSADIDTDEALTYGISYSGICLLSFARVVSESRPCNCFVIGCSSAAPKVYSLHVMERQKFPGWKTGFITCVHPSLNKRRIGLCKKHLKDIYLGQISLQSIDFSSWN